MRRLRGLGVDSPEIIGKGRGRSLSVGETTYTGYLGFWTWKSSLFLSTGMKDSRCRIGGWETVPLSRERRKERRGREKREGGRNEEREEGEGTFPGRPPVPRLSYWKFRRTGRCNGFFRSLQSGTSLR